MRLASPYFLLFLPLAVYIFIWKKKTKGIKFSSVNLLMERGMKKTIKHKIGKYFIFAGVTLLVVALARPQIQEKDMNMKEAGVDMAILFDVSGSMDSVDIEPNRLSAAKKTIESFVEQRPGDRMSLIIFAGSAYTKIPLTLDHEIIKKALNDVSSDDFKEGGTAIGMAMSVGLNRLKKSDSKSKVIILVTDGDNNAGSINPMTAAELAKDMDVKVYTIGVGTDVTIMPTLIGGQTVYKRYQGGLNEDILKNVSNITGGRYYRAKNQETLENIFKKINNLEKTDFDRDKYVSYQELAFFFILPGLLLLLIGIFLDRYHYMHIS